MKHSQTGLKRVVMAVVGTFALALPLQAFAGSPASSETQVRFGTFYHGYEGRESGTGDIALDVLLPAFDLGKYAPSGAFSLHPQVGADINLQGKTSAAFAGLAGVIEAPAGFVIEGDLGGSVNNGKTTSPDDTGRAELGCTALFREALGVGFHLSSKTTLMAVAEHMSNANLCTPNNGITNFGLRLGYSF
jgi:lipid A 3-O-deacylase